MPLGCRPCAAFRFVIALAASMPGSFAEAATITVNDPGDVLHGTGCAATGAGACTLRDAITFANANAGTDAITFTPGNFMVRVGAALPAITGPLSLAGEGFGVFRTTVDGSMAGAVDGLVFDGDGSSVRSLIVQAFDGSGIVLRGNGHTIGFPLVCVPTCLFTGVQVSNNRGHGIEVRGGDASVLQAVTAWGNGGHGVYLSGAATGNTVGTESAGLVAYGNAQAGVRVGSSPNDAATHSNSIVGSVYGNGGLAFDLGGDCVTSNDAGDVDQGPNGLLNFPLVTSAIVANGQVAVSGSFDGAPSAAHTLRLYVADESGPAGPPEGNSVLGKVSVTTNASGSAPWMASFPTSRPNGALTVVATATDAAGSTSEITATALEPPSGLALHTLPPCRLVDTRNAVGPLGGPVLTSGWPRSFGVHGVCGIPATARSLIVNLTVTNPSGSGHVSFSATGCVPASSAINFAPGQTRANNALLTLDAKGFSTSYPFVTGAGTVHLLVDVAGYME